MTSNRLPGKALKILGSKPLLSHVISRVKSATLVSKVMVATSEMPEDDPIANFCELNQISCFRGSLSDVAYRLSQAAFLAQVDSFIRINGDSPLIDPDLIDKLISFYKMGNYDLVTNTQLRTFPKGQSVEVIRLSSFQKMYSQIEDDFDREHVTTSYYKNPSLYNILNHASDDMSNANIQLSIDSVEDFNLIESILGKIDSDNFDYSSLIKIYRSMVKEPN